MWARDAGVIAVAVSVVPVASTPAKNMIWGQAKARFR